MPVWPMRLPNGQIARIRSDSPPTPEQMQTLMDAMPASVKSPRTQASTADEQPQPPEAPEKPGLLSRAASWAGEKIADAPGQMASAMLGPAAPLVKSAVRAAWEGSMHPGESLEEFRARRAGATAGPLESAAKEAALGAAMGPVVGTSPERVEALPDMAAMAGAAVGAPAGPLGIGAGAALGGAGGAAIRSMVRPLVDENAAPETLGEAARGVGIEAIKQPALEAAGGAIGAGVRRMLAPAAKSVSRRVLEAAGRHGIELPASAASESKLVQLGEAMSAKGFGGGPLTRFHKKSLAAVNALADHTVARAGKLQDPTAQGEAIATGYQKFSAEWGRSVDKLYREMETKLPENIQVDTSKIIPFLDSVITEKEAAETVLQGTAVSDLKMLKGIRAGLGGDTGKVSARSLIAANRELKNILQGTFENPASKRLLKRVSASTQGALVQSLKQQAPDAAEALILADKAYQRGITKITSTAAKSIRKHAAAGEYDKVAQSIIRPNMSADAIPQILELAGEEGKEAIQVSLIADMIGKATAPMDKSGTTSLTTGSLSKQIKSYGRDKLAEILTPEQLSNLEDLAVLSKSSEDMQRIIAGSQTGFINWLRSMQVGIGAAFASGASSMLGPLLFLVGGDMAAGRFLSSKVGRRWLTTGYPLTEGAKYALRQLPRGANVKINQSMRLSPEQSRRARQEWP